VTCRDKSAGAIGFPSIPTTPRGNKNFYHGLEGVGATSNKLRAASKHPLPRKAPKGPHPTPQMQKEGGEVAIICKVVSVHALCVCVGGGGFAVCVQLAWV
jgi:hypothetical protein